MSQISEQLKKIDERVQQVRERAAPKVSTYMFKDLLVISMGNCVTYVPIDQVPDLIGQLTDHVALMALPES
jgi:hypothetical protein